MSEVLYTLNSWWKMGDPIVQKAVRGYMLDHFGHAPDPKQTGDQVLTSITSVAPRCPNLRSGACLRCSAHDGGEVLLCKAIDPNAILLNDVERRSLLSSLLIGRSTRTQKKILYTSLAYQSVTLYNRMRVTPKVAVNWLRGRRDLLPLLDMLVGVHGLGCESFCTSVAILTQWGVHPITTLLNQRGTFSCCHFCAQASFAEFKTVARFGVTDGSYNNDELFDWQYVGQMLGRYDHEVFADYSDLSERTDYEKSLPVPNDTSVFRAEFDQAYEHEISEEGRRFGYLCAQGRKGSGLPYLHLCEAGLTAVPTGSIPAEGVPPAALSEIDKMLLNKKLAIIYMTKGEEEALKFATMHARSNWMWKLEIGKLRNLLPGSIGYYLGSARVSMYGESRFLGTLPNCPLMWGEAHKEVDNRRFAEWQDIGYVANRDYKNYNICHKHERMQMFYLSAAKSANEQGEFEMSREFEYLASCLNDVGVYVDGQYQKWEYGLQSGWAHTMLFHCVHNACAARCVEAILTRELGWKRWIGRHQGDDSAEIWDQPLAGPVAQALLDAAGQVGQDTKQHFAGDLGGWSEFLRIRTQDGAQKGSTIRALASFVSADSQHAPYEGGIGMVKAIVSGCNTVWRRSGGKLGWRQSDIAMLLEFWSTSNRRFKEKGPTDWRLHLSDESGLVIGAYPEMRWVTSEFRKVVTARYDLEVGPTLIKRARRNLQRAARAQEAQHYAMEYAKDVIECSVARSGDVEGVLTGDQKPHPPAGPDEQWAALCAARHCWKGAGGWRDEDAFAREVVVGHYFAGSERVARAYLKDGLRPIGHCSPRMVEILTRGINLLAGKTRELRPMTSSYYCCAEKYWSHIEHYVQHVRIKVHLNHGALGIELAKLAIKSGEWL